MWSNVVDFFSKAEMALVMAAALALLGISVYKVVKHEIKKE